MTTTITVVGTIATEPRLITPASGNTLCSFRLASDERRYDREQQAWVESGTNWFGVVCFRTLAGHAQESFKKGDRIIVQGRYRSRNWEKEDRKGVSIEIEAEAIGHDVRWGVSRFEKRMGSHTRESAGDGEVADRANQEVVHEDRPAPEAGDQAAGLRTSNGEVSDDSFVPRLAAA